MFRLAPVALLLGCFSSGVLEESTPPVDAVVVTPPRECQTDSDCPDGRCVEGECFACLCAEGDEEACGEGCAAGTRRCVDCVWRSCVPRAPSAECEAGVTDAAADAAPSDGAIGDAGDGGGSRDGSPPTPDAVPDVPAGPACTLAERKPSGDVRLGAGWFPEAIWTGSRVGVFYDRQTAGGLTPQTWFAGLSPAGAVLAAPQLVVERHFSDAVWTGGVYVAVTIEAGRLALHRLRSTGAVSSTVELPDLTRSGLEARLAWDGESVALIWSETLEELHFARFDSSLVQQGAARRLTNAAGRSYEPQLVPDALGYTVVFTDERADPESHRGEIYLLQLRRDGTKRALERPIAPGKEPSLAPLGGGFALSFTQVADNRDAIFAARLDGEGRLVGQPVRVSDSPSNARSSSLATAGGGVGVTYVDHQHDGQAELYFARLDQELATAGPPLRLTEARGDSLAPRVVGTDAGFAVTWFDHRAVPDDHERSDVYAAAGPLYCEED